MEVQTIYEDENDPRQNPLQPKVIKTDKETPLAILTDDELNIHETQKKLNAIKESLSKQKFEEIKYKFDKYAEWIMINEFMNSNKIQQIDSKTQQEMIKLVDEIKNFQPDPSDEAEYQKILHDINTRPSRIHDPIGEKAYVEVVEQTNQKKRDDIKKRYAEIIAEEQKELIDTSSVEEQPKISFPQNNENTEPVMTFPDMITKDFLIEKLGALKDAQKAIENDIEQAKQIIAQKNADWNTVNGAVQFCEALIQTVEKQQNS